MAFWKSVLNVAVKVGVEAVKAAPAAIERTAKTLRERHERFNNMNSNELYRIFKDDRASMDDRRTAQAILKKRKEEGTL